ncbi:MAG: hypothetical protein KDB35_23790 [Acidimicrobiales bacterium]|nr:hypothetical protein [Acidimicrobiales bacterium]
MEARAAAFTKQNASGSDLDETRQADDKGDSDISRTADSKATDADTYSYGDPKDFDVTDPGGQGRFSSTDSDFGDYKDNDISRAADSKIRDEDTSRTADPKGDPDRSTVNDPVGSRG